ncbi:HlyC/CorC family transporter [Simkania negevensis]|uniref:HlyC/CorC family transporter n=1 Tax=Simkania negevensis TaxID=83561 RepID=A0ABS3AW68_9BACT|nr:HlyC/CorC family transporter [Simkania negevensis]
MNNVVYWLLLTLLLILIQSFFSMLEMACVSFNPVRRHYYVTEKKQRIIWLDHLLKKPSRLFGTTLLGVNFALQIGSECSRELYTALGLDPSFAPLTQVLLVVIIAELAPMFAAQRYPEHVVMLGVPIIYAFSKVMAPIIWVIGFIAHAANRLVGGKGDESGIFLTREELQRVIIDSGDEAATVTPKEETQKTSECTEIVTNIFAVKSKKAKDVMVPLRAVKTIASNCTIEEMRDILKITPYPLLPIYYKTVRNIVGLAFPRDLLRSPKNHRVRDYARPPWFITQSTPVLQILKQFRYNNQSVAVVINDQGQAQGILMLEDVLEEIFGEAGTIFPHKTRKHKKPKRYIERTLPGEMTLNDFNDTFGTRIKEKEAKTIEEMIIAHLGKHPEKGESLRVGNLEFTVLDASLTEVKSVRVQTVQ